MKKLIKNGVHLSTGYIIMHYYAIERMYASHVMHQWNRPSPTGTQQAVQMSTIHSSPVLQNEIILHLHPLYPVDPPSNCSALPFTSFSWQR